MNLGGWMVLAVLVLVVWCAIATDNTSFRQLQSNLGEIEEAVQNSRRYDNAVARDLNTAVESFPSNFTATTFQFKKKGFFELDRPEERQVPRVSFS